jgi:hypothetical protein
VYALTPQAEQEWQQMADRFYPKIRGTIVPADLFDEVRRLVAEYRALKPAAPAKPAAPDKKEPAKPAAPVKK